MHLLPSFLCRLPFWFVSENARVNVTYNNQHDFLATKALSFLICHLVLVLASGECSCASRRRTETEFGSSSFGTSVMPFMIALGPTTTKRSQFALICAKHHIKAVATLSSELFSYNLFYFKMLSTLYDRETPLSKITIEDENNFENCSKIPRRKWQLTMMDERSWKMKNTRPWKSALDFISKRYVFAFGCLFAGEHDVHTLDIFTSLMNTFLHSTRRTQLNNSRLYHVHTQQHTAINSLRK